MNGLLRYTTGRFDAAGACALGGRRSQQDAILLEQGIGPILSVFAVSDGHGALGACSRDVLALFAEQLSIVFAEGADLPLAEGLAEAVARVDALLCERLSARIDAALMRWEGGGVEISGAEDAWLQETVLEPVEGAAQMLAQLGKAHFHEEWRSGATLTALIESVEGWFVVQLGDSVACQVRARDGATHCLTQAHLWSEEEATELVGDVLFRHQLSMSRALGHPPLKEASALSAVPDVHKIEQVEAGDVFVLYSDGLLALSEVSEEPRSLTPWLAPSSSAEAAVLAMLAEATPKAWDNLSVIVVRLLSREVDA